MYDNKAYFILESIPNPKFPYRLTIIQNKKILLSLRVQDKWPGQKGHIFCIREKENKTPDIDNIIEKIPIVYMRRIGKRLVLILNRNIKKRCDFLFLKKKYKNKEGEYEQIFWRTEQGLKQNKPKVKLTTYHHSMLEIIIDSNEKYPWKFPGSLTSRKKLPIGDYALIHNEEYIAVVERKTFENFLKEFGQMSYFHQHLIELKAYKNAALVIEANYSDFFNEHKSKIYAPAFSAKAIAEIFAYHPDLTIVFAGNRKLANEWTYKYFEAVKAHIEDEPHYKISDIIEKYKLPEKRKGGINYEIRNAILHELPETFKTAFLKEKFNNVSENTIRKVLNELRNEGKIVLEKHGSKSFWRKITK
ncbi:ERCC4 domain-containing protein [Marinitoga hydrogenitolerans DSM 16785]|uniref:ERCC4 domain-containing protein n=1 Tax=Marinitoga hydrogenitolerans (strain DSM 16785 / JCM 12826 / AT1271) TaxID=1122195 RepID=A0A1M4SP06_MARH1|nr:ERCC4 domain-containing protein [Marinitoga hydrogenitolerans]SHE33960.1 ERCC4 domain-containing protein [Marinitoga hydrogenitolerans DSM 16785]